MHGLPALVESGPSTSGTLHIRTMKSDARAVYDDGDDHPFVQQ